MKRFIKKLFYNPYRAARHDSRITIGKSTILLDSVRFHFRADGGKVTIGENSMIGCNFIFESSAGEIVIGEGTYIGGGTQLISRNRIEIGRGVMLGWGIYVYDHNSH